LRALVQRIQELEAEVAKLRDEVWKAKARPSKLLATFMLLIGSIIIVSSVFYATAILAFIGLGFTFWGALLLQIRPTRFVDVELVESTALSSIIAVDRLLDALGPMGKPVYLPGEDLQATSVFLPLDSTKSKLISSNPDEHDLGEDQKGVKLVPPGLSLATLMSYQIGQIPKWAVANLTQKLTRILIENLEVANDFEMNVEGSRVKVRFQDPIYSELFTELRRRTNVAFSVGCPICSAIACLLSETTGRPVAFEGESVSGGGRIMESNYTILPES